MELDWEMDVESEVWLYNAITGCYYGYFNDGDAPAGAIENNRCHGFNSLDDLKTFAGRLDVPQVMAFLSTVDCYDAESPWVSLALERAMDEAIAVAYGAITKE